MKIGVIACMALVTVGIAASPALAQPAPPAPLVPIEAPNETGAIALPVGNQSQRPAERWSKLFGQTIVRNVSQPTITPFLPDPAKATGAAVIIAPGGGFAFLSMDSEGWAVGKWLADHGIAAFVLKYRLNETPADDAAFAQRLMAFVAAASSSNGTLPELKEPRATHDAFAALRHVRNNAAQFGVDPTRVGMIGFSAGAITTLNTVLEGNAAERPAFVGYIYGPMNTVTVPAGAPPMFAALAQDDTLFAAQGFGIVSAWRAAGRPVELHAYEQGGHGFGMGKPGTTSTLVMPQFHAWLAARGLLERK